MFEHRSQPLLSSREFFGRMARTVAVVAGIVAFSLLMGSAGYHYLGGLPWIDSLLNAAMILAGKSLPGGPNSQAVRTIASWGADQASGAAGSRGGPASAPARR